MCEVRDQLTQVHDAIAAFLSRRRERFDPVLRTGSHAHRLMLILFQECGLSTESLCKELGIGGTTLSKAKGRLNAALCEFSKDYGIDPPIQVYHISAARVHAGAHFSCKPHFTKKELEKAGPPFAPDSTNHKEESYQSGKPKDDSHHRTSDVVTLAHVTTILADAEARAASSSSTDWKSMYRDSVLDDTYRDSPRWIQPMTCETQSRDPDVDRPRLRLSAKDLVGLSEVVNTSKNVFVTGSSGSGKTTAFRLLENSWMSGDGPHKLAFYIRLHQVEPLLEEMLARHHRINLAHLLATLAVSAISSRYAEATIRQCLPGAGDSTRPGDHAQLGPDILGRLRSAVKEWFTEQGRCDTNTLLLLDGMNDLRPYVRNALVTSVAGIMSDNCHLVISSQPTHWTGDSALYSGFRHVMLTELSPEQVVAYLDASLDGLGQYVYDRYIRHSAVMRSLTKNPFFLSLITPKLQRKGLAYRPNRYQILRESAVDSLSRKEHLEGYQLTGGVAQDTIVAVLPYVAKWLMDCLIQDRPRTVQEFLRSDEYAETRCSPGEVHHVMEAAEICGLLSTSGLLTDSLIAGSTEFAHDYFRDFFAAMYLERIGEDRMLEMLPELIEFTIWDRPLELFLESCSDERVCKRIIDYLLSHDVILAAGCTRYAKAADLNLRQEIVRRMTDANCWWFVNLEPQYYPIAPLKKSHLFESFSITELLDMTWQLKKDHEWRSIFWGAISNIVTPQDFGLLVDAWHKACDDADQQFWIGKAIGRIPTREAFAFVTDLYKRWREEKDVPVAIEHLILDGDIIPTDYTPTVAEVREYVDVDSPHFRYYLERVRTVTEPDLPLLQDLLDHGSDDMVAHVVYLLGQLKRPEVLEMLRHLWRELDSPGPTASRFCWVLDDPGLRFLVLCELAELGDPGAEDALLAELKGLAPEKRILRLSGLLGGPRRHDLLRFLCAKACHIGQTVPESSSDTVDVNDPRLNLPYAELLHEWPDESAVLTELHRLCDSESAAWSPYAVLIGTWLGCKHLSPLADTILDELHQHCATQSEREALLAPVSNTLYQDNNYHYILSYALRAVRNRPDSSFANDIVPIIDLACYMVLKDMPFDRRLVDILCESLSTLAAFVAQRADGKVIEDMLKTGVIRRILATITVLSNTTGIGDELTSAFLQFCECTPRGHIKPLLWAALIRYALLDNDDATWTLALVVVRLCSLTDAEVVAKCITFLYHQSEKRSDDVGASIIPLVRNIKYAVGRRFLKTRAG